MDPLDLQILRQLSWKPDDPAHLARGIRRPWDIARALDVHGTTVKRRLAALAETGVFLGVHLHPAPALLGVRSGVFRLRFGSVPQKREGLARLEARADVWDVHDFVGDEAWVGVVAPDEASLADAATRAGADAGAADATPYYRREWRVEREHVTALDWRILAALVTDAHRPVQDVAEEVGVTTKTVRARLTALEEDRAFAVVPQIRLARARGLVAFVLAIEFGPGVDLRHRGGVLSAFPEAFYRSAPTERNAFMLLAAEDSAGVEDHVLRAGRMRGVRAARALLVRGTHADPAKVAACFPDRARAAHQR